MATINALNLAFKVIVMMAIMMTIYGLSSTLLLLFDWPLLWTP